MLEVWLIIHLLELHSLLKAHLFNLLDGLNLSGS